MIDPVATRIRQRLAGEAAPARADLFAALDSPRYADLLTRVDALADTAPEVPTGWLRRRARKALRRADRRLDAATTDEERHDARKAYKRARYAVEVLRPVAGKPAKRLANRLSTLQDVLGAYNDSIVTGQLLREHGMRAHAAGENAFTYGLLHGRQHEAGADALRGLDRARRRSARRRGFLKN